MGKYAENRYHKFDCPVSGCNRVGKNGFDSPQGVGHHLRNAHSSAETMATAGGPNGHGDPEIPLPTLDTLGDTPRLPDAAPSDLPGFKVPATGVPSVPSQFVRENAAGLMELAMREPRKSWATAAVTAILALPDVQNLPEPQIGAVFETVQRILRLDRMDPQQLPDLFAERERQGREAGLTNAGT